MNIQSLVDSVNQKSYAKTKILDYYDDLNELFSAEKVLLEKLFPKIKNSKILDIGIGGGRTTKYLLAISSDYTGLDYVPQFIERVERKYKRGSFLCGDARDLKQFASETFDFVLFAYNGIDNVSHEDRLKALKEIRRVLKKGGTFMFSSHNRDYHGFNKPHWRKEFSLNAKFVKNLLSYFFFLPKHLRMKNHEVFADGYAIINDCDHRYSLLTYYVAIGTQIGQLEKVGFSDVGAYNAQGESVKTDTVSFWIYYLTNR